MIYIYIIEDETWMKQLNCTAVPVAGTIRMSDPGWAGVSIGGLAVMGRKVDATFSAQNSEGRQDCPLGQ